MTDKTVQQPQSGPRMRIRSLMGWGVSAQLIYVACQFVTLIGLTRFATVSEVGMFGLASAIVIPVFFFFGLGMRVNVASSLQSDYAFRDFLFLLSVSLAAGLALVSAIGVLSFSGSQLLILLILAATKSAECLSELCYGVFQRYDRMNLVAGSIVLRSAAGTALFVALLVSGLPVVWAFSAQLLVWSTVALLLDLRVATTLSRANQDTSSHRSDRVYRLARESIPLAANGLLSALQGNMPRYVIAWLLGTAALGQFTAVAYAMQAITTVTMAAVQSLVARFREYIAASRRHALTKTFIRLFAGLTLIGLVCVGVSVLIGDWLVQTVFGPDYVDLGALLAVCVLAGLLRASTLVLQGSLMAGRAFSIVLQMRMVSMAVMLSACTLGGILGGLVGVAIGMCTALTVFLLMLVRAVKTHVFRPMSNP
ncbi:lipopolysaccharide biosynthesis protein [Ruegeria aquimaris]|uniref:Lipopolysaccharide biosynthesis protein n=1 Tax=Ruegeria aquimaris TaxID=2984333 RepID=A0ABT3AF42_9RHOB|nr:lipopolysaccharide biosynthesis protein [Ruegeria sp. XHP0148]MCV2886861.1 lipopolysaccharide biosynthesis protein [Ruegeria sp. XHP0148]